MKPIEYKLKNNVVKNIPRVISIDAVVNPSDTILSDEFQKNGYKLEFETAIEGISGPITSLTIPPCPHFINDGMIIIDDIAIKLNNILRVIELIKKGEKEHKHLVKSVKSLQALVVSKIVQKDGILNREILGSRMNNTARGVLTPSCGLPPEFVRLPYKIKSTLKLKKGSLVIVGRDPTIWDGSIEVLKATFWRHKSIGLSPLVYKQMGADNDGDTVWVLKVPKSEKCQLAASRELLGFTKKSVSSISRANVGSPPEPFYWDSGSSEEILTKTTGFSISPLDIINQTENTSKFELAIGKKIQDEALKISKGLSDQEFKDWLITVNLALLVQKKYLGPAGAASNKLKLIGTIHPLLLKSANYVSERLQQCLFDFKGTINSNNNNVDIFDFLNIVTMKRDYKNTYINQVGHTQAINRLRDYGLDVELAAPIITYIYTVHGILDYCASLVPMSKLKEQDVFNNIINLCNYEICSNKESFIGHLRLICNYLKISVEQIMSNIVKYRLQANLGSILRDPIYELTNQVTVINSNTIEQLKELRFLLEGNRTNNLITSDILVKASNV